MQLNRGMAGLALVMAGIGGAADAAVTFDRAAAFARVRGTIGAEVYDPAEKSAEAMSLPAGPLAASDAVDASSGRALFASTASSGATFGDTANGTLSIGASAAASTLQGSPNATAAGFAAVSYYFTVDRLSLLTFDFSVERSGDTDILPTAQANITRRSQPGGGNSTATLFNQTGITGSGMGAVDLAPGSYLLVWSNYGTPASVNAENDPGMESINGALTFNIVAAAVPEPASWAMMIGGFGLVGGTVRRRRIAAVA